MSEEDFCYWLLGYIEISGTTPSPVEWRKIKDRLELVFPKNKEIG